MEPVRRPRTVATMMLVLIALLVGAIGTLAYFGKRTLRKASEESAAKSLKLICSAECDFSVNDRDGNGVKDYWTRNVADLYYRAGPTGVPGQTSSMRLIPPGIAQADAGCRLELAARFRPHSGYLFVAMDTDETGVPYKQVPSGWFNFPGDRNPSKFAFCAYPSKYGHFGALTFIVNERATVYARDTGGRPVLAWPADLASAGWGIHD